MDRLQLYEHLMHQGVLKTSLIIDAFKQIDRRDFVTDDYAGSAYEDAPQPIGYGQTISQPSTVAFMLELLQPQPGQNILDVGTGSGWTTALLSACVGVNGKVYGVEIISDLVEFGRGNLKKYHLPQASIQLSEPGTLGMPMYAPFDRILVSAESAVLPQELIDQLVVGGTMVIPIGQSIFSVRKAAKDNVVTTEYPGFVFVPLV